VSRRSRCARDRQRCRSHVRGPRRCQRRTGDRSLTGTPPTLGRLTHPSGMTPGSGDARPAGPATIDWTSRLGGPSSRGASHGTTRFAVVAAGVGQGMDATSTSGGRPERFSFWMNRRSTRKVLAEVSGQRGWTRAAGREAAHDVPAATPSGAVAAKRRVRSSRKESPGEHRARSAGNGRQAQRTHEWSKASRSSREQPATTRGHGCAATRRTAAREGKALEGVSIGEEAEGAACARGGGS
jgi:hypothetical protein